MSYENSFCLKILGETTRPSLFCPVCKQMKSGKFCSECGTTLEMIQLPVDKNDIIKELREFSDDCAFLLDEKGNTHESGNGYTIDKDIQRFSLRYPNLIFQLDIGWDSGFGNEPSRYYFKNGEKQDVNTKIVYDEPKFDL